MHPMRTTAVRTTHKLQLPLSTPLLEWLDEIAQRDAKEGEKPNRAATVRRLIRQERERAQKESQ